jgi:uncharacterized coiled-coil DUF342 family protein
MAELPQHFTADIAAAAAEVASARAAAEASVASLTSQLESLRSSQSVASEEAAMLRATLDKVRARARAQNKIVAFLMLACVPRWCC